MLRALATAERHHLFHGAAITISADNAPLFAARATLDTLRDAGSRFALFLDYLPAIGIPQDRFSTPPAERAAVVANARAFAAEHDFFCRLVPEDEALFGGCMAAGREDPVRQRLRHHRSLSVRPVLELALPRDHVRGGPAIAVHERRARSFARLGDARRRLRRPRRR